MHEEPSVQTSGDGYTQGDRASRSLMFLPKTIQTTCWS